MAMDDASILAQVIDVAERALYRNSMLVGADLDRLMGEIQEARRLPPPRAVGDETTMLMTALLHCGPSLSGRDGQWRQAAFALLDLVKIELGRLIERRRDLATRSDPEAQPSYRGGG